MTHSGIWARNKPLGPGPKRSSIFDAPKAINGGGASHARARDRGENRGIDDGAREDLSLYDKNRVQKCSNPRCLLGGAKKSQIRWAAWHSALDSEAGHCYLSRHLSTKWRGVELERAAPLALAAG